MRSTFSFLVTLFICIQFSTAQSVLPCATDQMHAQQIAQNPELKAIEAKAKELLKTNTVAAYQKANGIVYIPVVFHIIHNDGFENISQAQIMDQIRVLNEDYRRAAGTPGFNSESVSADVQIEFRLAQYDPSGNKSDGINRVKSVLTDSANDNVKALSYWDSNKYLNVWVVKTIKNGLDPSLGTVLGYAQFPWDRNSRPKTDGVVIRYDQIGVIGSGQISQGGRTLTHEIGHWLGLYHTFQNGCMGGTSSDCATQGDGVCDTPPVASSSSGCNVGQNSCNNDIPNLPDMVRNYMDYSDGSCMNIFTSGQKNRMYSAMLSYRNTIYGSGNNNVSYAGIDASSGNYLSVTPSAIKAPYTNNFENNPMSEGWKLNNFNNSSNGWQVNNSVAIEGNSSMYMRNFTNSSALLNGRDGFQSPEIDITQMASPFVEFYYAYAQRSSVSTDSLILIISNNFGMNETRIFGQRGDNLATSVANTSEFFPTPNDSWKKVSINITSYKGTNTRFRYEFVNRRGNNVYVDKFSITDGATGIGEQAKEEIKFETFPNPMTNTSVLSFELNQPSAVTISLLDITGRVVRIINNSNLTSGKHELELQKTDLSNGLYFIDFKSAEANFTHKLLVN